MMMSQHLKMIIRVMKRITMMMRLAKLMMMRPVATRMMMTTAILMLMLKKLSVRNMGRKTTPKPSVVLKSANLLLGARTLMTKRQVVALSWVKVRNPSY